MVTKLLIIQNAFPYEIIPVEEYVKKTNKKLPFALSLSFSIFMNWIINMKKYNQNLEINLMISVPKQINEIEKKVYKLYQKYKIRKIYVIRASTYSILENFYFSFMALKILLSNRKNIDIIHARYPFSSLIPIYIIKQLKFNIKTIYEIRNPWLVTSLINKNLPQIFKKGIIKIGLLFELIMMKKCDGIMYMNKRLFYYYEQYDKKRILKKIPYLNLEGELEERLITNSSTNRKNKKIIRLGYIGSLEKWRGLDKIIMFFASLIRYYKDYKFELHFFGAGDAEKQLKDLAKKLNIKDVVVFHGAIPRDKIEDAFKIVDIGISHLDEGLISIVASPMKVIEYSYFGVPTIANNVVAHRTFKEYFKFIEFYDNDEESFIQAVQNAIINLQKYNSEEIQKEIKKQFGYISMANRVNSFYKNVFLKNRIVNN